MKKLYDKSEIWFAVAWIAAYVVLASVGDNISADLGIGKIVTLPILITLSAVLYLFVRKNGLSEKYGLSRPRLPAAKLLYYFPLLVLLTANLWYGAAVDMPALETVLYILAMFCVGFLEELIFRGLLFRAMAKNGVRSAIVVSSVTFGIGHIVNLFNGSGAELLPNLLQVMYAMAIGFAFVMICCRTGSLMPCILTHSIFNGLSAFANEAAMTPQREIVSGILLTVIAGGYALYLALALEDVPDHGEGAEQTSTRSS
ncbi:MAG: CPBP family intramembrane metalloprotease [Clostridia bacterium]|nr:CPBP family intramembrane metalloprotease [Clostridia bacterium]